MLRRLQSHEVCERYAELVQYNSRLENDIKDLQIELEHEQTEFLGTYFDQINEIYNRLGSGKFNISKVVSRRGLMPTIQIQAFYAGARIARNNLSSFFSESDRRALALSIFCAKVLTLDPELKRNAIVILDDPVTSFDDGRIERTIRLMETFRRDIRQIIVLSHYPLYLKLYFDRANSQAGGIQLIRIHQNQDSSEFKLALPNEFVDTPHQKAFRHIMGGGGGGGGFIERQHSEDILLMLRVFLENEIKSRYRKQISDHQLEKMQLGELLEALLHLGAIDEAKFQDLEEFRRSLNPDHHIWTSRSHEEKIGLSTDILNFVYTRL